MKQSRATSDTGIHEIGHAFEVDHSSSGIVTAASNDPNRSDKILGAM